MPRPDDWAHEIAPAKLNLALHVRRRRADGYHDLDTLFAFCAHGDALRARPAERLSIACEGPFAPDLEGHDNLALEAARRLQRAAGVGSGAEIVLDKRLPVASGIGGGSADAAAALRLLTRLWGLDPRHAEDVAPTLGADVPACLLSETARGSGTGTVLVREDVGLSGAPVLLVNPGVEVSTAAVFRGWDGIDHGPLGADWRQGRNDLEPPARASEPLIDELLAFLNAREGVEVARMSGSGATCFALFDTAAARDAAAAAVPHKWWHLASSLR